MKKEGLEIVKSGLIVVDMVNGFINEGQWLIQKLII